jgi:hypothetical protein
MLIKDVLQQQVNAISYVGLSSWNARQYSAALREISQQLGELQVKFERKKRDVKRSRRNPGEILARK